MLKRGEASSNTNTQAALNVLNETGETEKTGDKMSRIDSQRVDTAFTRIKDELQRETNTPEGVTPSELKAFVEAETARMGPEERAALKDRFTNDTGERPVYELFYGVTDTAVIDAVANTLTADAGNTVAPGSGSPVFGTQGMQTNREQREAAVAELNRIRLSPMPGETRADVLDALRLDPSIANAGDLNILADRFAGKKVDLPFAAVLNAFVDTDGKTGPSEDTMAGIDRQMLLEAPHAIRRVANVISGDDWLIAMFEEIGGGSLELAEYLMMPSQIERSRLIDLFFIPGETLSRAKNAIGTLRDIKAMAPNTEALPDTPEFAAPEDLSDEHVQFIIQYKVDDFRIEENAGRYIVAGRSDANVDVSREHIEAALARYSSRDLDFRANIGDWAARTVVEDALDPQVFDDLLGG